MRSRVLLLAGLTGVALSGCNAAPPDATPSPIGSAPAPSMLAVDVAVSVVSKPLDTVTHLEGELSPYEAVRARRAPPTATWLGSWKSTGVSEVKAGQLIATLVAPELKAPARAEAQAKLLGDTSTEERLQALPGHRAPSPRPRDRARDGDGLQAPTRRGSNPSVPWSSTWP